MLLTMYKGSKNEHINLRGWEAPLLGGTFQLANAATPMFTVIE